MNERTFVLGVGAQKAGTTWLHSYVSASVNANMGILKEYHIWDAVYSKMCKGRRETALSLLRVNQKKYIRYRMQNAPGFYEDYFRSIYESGAQISGDITPSYSVLTEDDFHEVRGRIKLMGARVRCVFLMRDPVERCWSAVRMSLRKRNKRHCEEKLLEQSYSSEQFQFRTRYELICERLRHVFDEDELYFGFYETMFDENELERLSKFLNVPVNYEYRKMKVNESPKKSEISTDLREKIKCFYSETYDYCFEHFEQTKLIWK